MIDNQYYAVPGEVLPEIERAVLEAAREGGGFVRLGEDGHHVDVLVTPSTPVRMEHEHLPAPLAADPAVKEATGGTDMEMDWWLGSG